MKKFGCVVLSLLIGTAACSAMAGCGKSYDGEVNVYNWGDYIANGEDGTLDVIDEFEKEYNIKVNYTTYETNEELYNMLKKQQCKLRCYYSVRLYDKQAHKRKYAAGT